MEQKKKFVLPPGCTAKHANSDPHIQYRCPVLGRAVTMELRRCTYTSRNIYLLQHIKNGNHIFNLPRDQDKEFPKRLLIDNKLKTKDDVQQSIMRACAILSSILNISAKNASSSAMEEFIHILGNQK